MNYTSDRYIEAFSWVLMTLGLIGLGIDHWELFDIPSGLPAIILGTLHISLGRTLRKELTDREESPAI